MNHTLIFAGNTKMNNLSPAYQLRIDRIRRLREGFRSHQLTEHEFRECMCQEGIMDRRDLDAEVRDLRRE